MPAVLRKREWLLAAVVLCFLFAQSPRGSYCVEVEGRGGSIVIGPLGLDDRIAISYTHSVDLAPVVETFAIKPDGLVLIEDRFVHWGAGLGYMGEGFLSEIDGVTVISGMNRKLKEMILRVGSIGDHRILCRGRETRLLDFFPPLSPVKFKVRRMERLC